MTSLRTERARIRRALRVAAADYLGGCIILSRDNRLHSFLQKEKARLTRALRAGRAIGALTSRPRAARKGSE